MNTSLIGREVVFATDAFSRNVGTVMRHINQHSVEVYWRNGSKTQEFVKALYPLNGRWETA